MSGPPRSGTRRSGRARRWLESGAALARGWREKGPLHFSTMVIERLVSPSVFDFGIIQIVGLDFPESLPEEDAFAEIRWAGPEDLDLLSQLGIPRQQLEPRFEQDQWVLIREKAGRIIAYMWIDWTRFELTLFRIAFRPGDVYGFDARTARDLRGRHLYRSLMRYSSRALKERGKTRLIGAIMSTNKNSLRMVQQEGFRTIGRIAYVVLFGFTIARIGRDWTCRYLTQGQKIECSIDATRFS